MPSQGFIYVATGADYRAEAIVSAESLRRAMPHTSITLFTDVPSVPSRAFDQIITLDNAQRSYADKVACIGRTPYDLTIFLDTDTYVCADVSELFTLLDRFDVLAAHDKLLYTFHKPEIPLAFAEFNTGVVAFKRSPAFLEFWQRWQAYHVHDSAHGIHLPGWDADGDQPAFRQALYESNLRHATLPAEYNCFFNLPGFVSGEVKILHGRVDQQERQQVLRSALVRKPRPLRLPQTRGGPPVINVGELVPRVHGFRGGKLRVLARALVPQYYTGPRRKLTMLRLSLYRYGLRRTIRYYLTGSHPS